MLAICHSLVFSQRETKQQNRNKKTLPNEERNMWMWRGRVKGGSVKLLISSRQGNSKVTGKNRHREQTRKESNSV